MNDSYHLSVVATGRNDNHGESFLYRMQHFIDGFIEQCKKHQLKAELIIVEWNPPEENEPLYKALKFPEEKGPCAIRFIRVPKEIHMKLKHSDQMQLYQMIAKNVGIRRALGKFVLATNIDILFTDYIMMYMRDRLKKNKLYRADRLDVPSRLPTNSSFPEILDFCAQNYFRINGKYGTLIKKNENWKKSRSKVTLKLKIITQKIKEKFKKTPFLQLLKKGIPKSYKYFKWGLFAFLDSVCYWGNKIRRRLTFKAHTNGCGDFTLLSYQDWKKLKGYPEWEIYSWHLDSVLLYQAKQAGIEEIDLPRKMAVYHIEHSFASGYTPEAYNVLFQRLRNQGIAYLTNTDIDAISFRAMKDKEPIVDNDDLWGFAHISFEEIRI